MQAITGITAQPTQILNLSIEDGSTATLTLTYRPQQSGWFFELEWNGTNPSKDVNGMRVTNFPNILRQFENLITFGLACITRDGLEPMGRDDFQTGYATMLLLTAAEVELIEDTIFVGL